MLQNLMEQPQAETTETPAENSGNYHFFTGEMNDFVNEMAEEKEDMGIPVDDTPDEEPEPTPSEPPVSARGRKLSAQFVARMADGLFSHTLQFVAKEDSNARFSRMKDEMMDDFVDAIDYYCQQVNGEIPPSMMIVICVVMMYGIQIPDALRLRKQHELEEKAEQDDER